MLIRTENDKKKHLKMESAMLLLGGVIWYTKNEQTILDE